MSLSCFRQGDAPAQVDHAQKNRHPNHPHPPVPDPSLWVRLLSYYAGAQAVKVLRAEATESFW